MGGAPAGRPRRPQAALPPQPTPGIFGWLQVALVLVYVWRIQDLVPALAKVQLPILTSAAALAVLLFGGWLNALAPRLRHPLVRVAAFILVWMCLSVPGGVYPGLSFGFILNDHIKTFLMMLVLVAGVRNMADVKRLVLAMIMGAMMYCLVTLTTFSVGADGRLGDLFYYDSNDLAMLLVCTLPLAAFMMRPGEKPKWRLAAMVVAGVFVITIVRTGSRGGFLGLIAVSAFMLFGFRAIPARTRITAVGLAAVVLFSVAGPQFWGMMGTMLHPKDDYNFNGNEAGRSAIWKRGMGYMRARPLVGVGANAFPQAEGMISELVEEQARGRGVKWSAAHNSFVQIGAELGVPGLAALIAQVLLLIGTCIGVARRRARASPAARALAQSLIATTIGYIVCGFFLSQAYSAYLYATCGMVIGLDFVSGRMSPAGAGRAMPSHATRRPGMRGTGPQGRVPVPRIS